MSAPLTPAERGYEAGIHAAIEHMTIAEIRGYGNSLTAEGLARTAAQHLALCWECMAVGKRVTGESANAELDAAMRTVLAAGYEITNPRGIGEPQ